MKRINRITILTMVIITLLIGANSNAQATQPNNNIKSIETTAIKEVEPINVITASTNNFYLEPNEIAIEYNNGSYEILKVESIDTTATGTLYNLSDDTGYYIEK